MAVIIFFRVKLFDRFIDIYPSSVGFSESVKDSFGESDTVWLYPSIPYDCRVSFVGGRDDAEEYALASLAAGLFLTEGRGLPLDELEIDSPARVFRTVKVKALSHRGIILPKCKVLYTNRSIFISNVELFYSSLVSFSKIIRIVKCSDHTAFSEHALRMLLYNGAPECIDLAVAYSGDEGEYFASAVSLSDRLPILSLVTAVVTDALIRDEVAPTIAVTIDHHRYLAERSGGDVVIIDPDAYLRMD